MKPERMQRGDEVELIYSPTVILHGLVCGVGWSRFQITLQPPAQEVVIGMPKSWASLIGPRRWQVRVP